MTKPDQKEHLNKVKRSLIEIGIEDQEIIVVTIAQDGLVKHGCYVDQYLDLLFKTIPKNTTLVMNCFTWKFCKQGFFDIKKTPSECGLASEVFRRTEGVIRSPHPLYSFCAQGPLAEELMQHPGPTCWGAGTPFEQLIKRNVFHVSLGKEFPRSMTILHSFEELKKVPYRFFKEFLGKVNLGEGEKDYKTSFYVRKDQEIDYTWKPAVDLLIKRGLVRGLNLDFPAPAVFAKDLQRVCYELLDKDPKIFLIKKENDNDKKPT